MITQALYKSFFDHSPSGYYLLTPSTDPVILDVNATFLKSCLRNREDLVDKKLFIVFAGNPDDTEDTGVENLKNSLQHVIDTGKPHKLPMQRYPIKVTLPDGSEQYEERFWDASNTPIFDEHGQLSYILHLSTEVTEQVHTEKALRKSQSRYQSLTESIDEGFCVIQMVFDAQENPIDYIFLEINPLFENHTGLHNAQGKSILALVPDIEKHWFEIYGKVAKTGEPIRFENGAKAMESRWFDVYAYPIDKPGENIVAVLFRDITQKKQQEVMVHQSEARLKALISATTDLVYRMSPDWSELRQLEGRGFVKDVSHSNKLWFDEYIVPEDKVLLRKAIDKGIQNKSYVEAELRVYLANGAIGWVNTRATPMLDTEGEITEWVGASTEITYRKQKEAELLEMAQRKDDFLAMLAHELRNPLAPISTAAELLNLGTLKQEKITQFSEIISRQVKHMTGLVDDLLDVSRVTRGLITLNQESIDLNEAIASSVEQIRPLIEKHKHEFTVHTPQKSVKVFGDQKRLVQVLANLLNNAAKYTPEGGQITLNMEEDEQGEGVWITVTDNGVGMEPGMVKQAFELFTQATRSPDRAQGGLGIGLALVKSLVELHRGKISASSQGLGQGTKFTLWLPQIQDVINYNSIESKPLAVNDFAPQASKIMVVDDNVDLADTLSEILELSGFQVMVEYSSLKALVRARIEKPSICLLDIGLPEMDGKELARRLRAETETADATFIAITGYSPDQYLTNTMNAEFDYFLVKPVDSAKLLALLNTIQMDNKNNL